MGQWVERSNGSWDWDPTPADPSVTRIMSAYAGGSPMADYSDHVPRAVSRDVYDPDLGSDGGGRYAESDPIPTIDPDNPVDHVDQLPGHDPAMRRDPATTELADPFGHGPASWATPSTELVACPCCGTGVHPDRIRD